MGRKMMVALREGMMARRIRLGGLVLVMALVVSGCLVRSVEPWFEDKELTFEEDLLGGWTGAKADGSDVAMTFVRGEKAPIYVVQYSDKEGQGTFEARLAKSGGAFYLDFRPRTEAQGVDGILLFRSHSVARLEISGTRLTVMPLDYGTVVAEAKLDRLRGVKFTWDSDGEIVFISKTEELQRFLLGLSADSKLFAAPIRLTRRR